MDDKLLSMHLCHDEEIFKNPFQKHLQHNNRSYAFNLNNAIQSFCRGARNFFKASAYILGNYLGNVKIIQTRTTVTHTCTSIATVCA